MSKRPLTALSLAVLLSLGASVAHGKGVGALVAEKAAIISNLHRKASRALVNAAQDRAFTDYFDAHDDGHRHKLKGRIEQVSLKVQERFHVEEMCFIDASGPELARIVGQKIADDLSADESAAIFFKPGLETGARKAYVSPIYMSADARRWVVAYVTPIMVENKRKGLLHYEHGLDFFQHALNKGVDHTTILVAVNADGLVISDSRKEIAIDMVNDDESPQTYFKPLNFLGMGVAEVVAAIDAGTAQLELDGVRYDAAYRKLQHWTLVAFSKSSP